MSILKRFVCGIVLPAICAVACPGFHSFISSKISPSPIITQADTMHSCAEYEKLATLLSGTHPGSTHYQADDDPVIYKGSRRELLATLSTLNKKLKLPRSKRGSLAVDYLRSGDVYFILSNYSRALSMYRHAVREAVDDIHTKSLALSRMARTHATLGNLSASLHYSGQALRLSKQYSDLTAIAQAFEAQGEALYYSDKLVEAHDLLICACSILSQTTQQTAEAQALVNAGYASNQLGKPIAALELVNKARRLSSLISDQHGLAEASTALGFFAVMAGDLDRALSEYEYAEKIFTVIGDNENEAIVLNGKSYVNAQIGKFEESLRCSRRAMRLFAAIHDGIGHSVAIHGAARALRGLHNYSAARLLYQTELKLAIKHHDHRMKVAALIDIASTYESVGQYDKAHLLYLQARQLSLKSHHPYGEADALIHLGHLDIATHKYDEALSFLKAGLQLARTPSHVAEINYDAALLHHHQSKLDIAQQDIEKTIQIIESERLKVSDFDSRASYFASVHNYYQLYIDILMQLDQQHPDQSFAQRAFEAAEKSKVRSLLDMLASSAAEKQCPAATAAQAENSGSQAGDCGVPAPSALTLEQVQAGIHGDNAVLLEYALAPDASYVWVVDEGRIYSFRLPGEKQISELARRYRSAITAHQPVPGEDAGQQAQRVAQADRDLEHLSGELSRVLLDPVAHLLTGKRLIIVPDGLLRYVPFAALQLPSGTGEKPTQTLAEKFEIVTLPSASALEILREASATRPAPTKLAKVFADPVFDVDDSRVSKRSHSKSPAPRTAILVAALRDVPVDSLRISRLAASGPEADAIAEALSGKADIAKGFDATRDAVLSGDLAQYRYLHFATHSLLDSKHPEFSGLILSLVNQNGQPEEGYLRVRDIYALKLSADLVVLSSCNSALGKDVESEGIIGLTRAFLFAGSRRVISSLWKVDDKATKELMALFYFELHAGKSPAAALRRAQSTMARDPYWSNPYYWAAFILQGEYK